MNEWISTGDALRVLGDGVMSADTFLRNYTNTIPHKKTAGGHHRWLTVAVEALRDQMTHAA